MHKAVAQAQRGQFGARRSPSSGTRRGADASKRMRLALYQPDIPQNTGTILRLGRLPGRARRPDRPGGFRHDGPRAASGWPRLSAPRRDRAARELCRLRDSARDGAAPASCLLTTHAECLYRLCVPAATTRCCWAAKAPACPRWFTRRPMPACAFRCGRGGARSTWPWRRRWCWARRCGRPAASVQPHGLALDDAVAARPPALFKMAPQQGHVLDVGAEQHVEGIADHRHHAKQRIKRGIGIMRPISQREAPSWRASQIR